jgi:hypothetical protein
MGRFGEHSGRRGGASAAIEQGANLQQLQTLGNWKDPKSATKYVEQNLIQKETLSRLLYPK